MPDRHGPLRIEDFVAQTDGVTLDDLPASAQDRLNTELAGLTGGTGETSGINRRDTDGILVSENLDGREGFQTIADALAGENLQNAGDKSASPPDSGATVLVEPGTYTGDSSNQLTIGTEGLTLLSREGPGETTVESQVIVGADDVTVAGLSVSPPEPGDTQGADEAIRVDGADSSADGVTIVDNVVEDFARNTGGDFTGIDGINIFGGDSGETIDPVENTTVRNNTVRRLQNTGGSETEFPGGAAGISVQGAVRNPTVEENTIENIGEEVTNFGFGIVVRGTGNNDETPTGVTIKDNTIDSVLSDPDSPTVGVGIGLEAGEAGDVTFTGNSISNTEFLLEDKTVTVDLNSFASSNTLDRGALLEEGDFEGVPGNAPVRNVIFDSIQFALNFATSGDTVEVVSGTYDDEKTFNGVNGLQIGSQDSGTDPASAPLKNVSIIGIDGRPTIPGWVQILDPGVTFERFEVTNEVFGYGLAAFEPDVTVRDVTISGVTNGLFVPSAANVLFEGCTVENYSFYGALVSGRGAFGGATPIIRNTTFDGASGSGAVGIGVIQTDAELEDNEITGNESDGDGAGVAHFSGSGVTIRENSIGGNDDGIFLAGRDSGTVSATSNDIVNNRVGVANEGSSTVKATGNWWGSSAGPGQGSNSTDGTQGPVNVEPWSTKSGPDWNTKGTSNTLSTASVETSGTDEKWQGPMPPSAPDRASE
jgi:hypothetical protein